MTKINSRPLGTVILSGIAVAMLSMAAPVLADPGMSSTRISVDTHDIDLASAAGIEKLNHRVDSAIRSACAPVEFGGPADFAQREQAMAQNACLSGAHASAAPQVQKLIANGNPKVAAF